MPRKAKNIVIKAKRKYTKRIEKDAKNQNYEKQIKVLVKNHAKVKKHLEQAVKYMEKVKY